MTFSEVTSVWGVSAVAILDCSSGYEMANKLKIKDERKHCEKEGKKREKTATLSEKKEEASNVSEQWDKGCT